MEAHWQNKYLHNISSSIGQGTPPKGLGKDNITVKNMRNLTETLSSKMTY